MSMNVLSIATLPRVLCFLAAALAPQLAAAGAAKPAPESPCPGYATADEAVRAAAQFARAKGMSAPAATPAASWFGDYWAVRFYATPRGRGGGEIQLDISLSGEIMSCWLDDGSPCAPFRDRSQSVCAVDGPAAMTAPEAIDAAAAQLDRHGIAHYPADRPPILVPEAGWLVQFPAAADSEPFTVSVTRDGAARNLMPDM